jgi:hypothetical protein
VSHPRTLKSSVLLRVTPNNINFHTMYAIMFIRRFLENSSFTVIFPSHFMYLQQMTALKNYKTYNVWTIDHLHTVLANLTQQCVALLQCCFKQAIKMVELNGAANRHRHFVKNCQHFHFLTEAKCDICNTVCTFRFMLTVSYCNKPCFMGIYLTTAAILFLHQCNQILCQQQQQQQPSCW